MGGSKDSRPRLLVFGDSNACRPGIKADCWPAILQRHSGNGLKVINASCDGRTTQYDAGECNGVRVIGKKLISDRPMDFVVVALGTNDVKGKYGPPDTTHVIAGIKQILQTIKKYAPGAGILLVVPPPLGNVTTGDLAGAQGRISLLASGLRQYAIQRQIPFVDLNAIIQADEDLEPDQVHLNMRGRKKAAGAVWDNFKGVHVHVKSVEQPIH